MGLRSQVDRAQHLAHSRCPTYGDYSCSAGTARSVSLCFPSVCQSSQMLTHSQEPRQESCRRAGSPAGEEKSASGKASPIYEVTTATANVSGSTLTTYTRLAPCSLCDMPCVTSNVTDKGTDTQGQEHTEAQAEGLRARGGAETWEDSQDPRGAGAEDDREETSSGADSDRQHLSGVTSVCVILL